MGSAIDWTQVVVALIAGLPAILGAVFSGVVWLRIRTPSGTSIGTQVEQANHLAAVNTAMTKDIHESVTNGRDAPKLEV